MQGIWRLFHQNLDPLGSWQLAPCSGGNRKHRRIFVHNLHRY
jgi:hypothetical protein